MPSVENAQESTSSLAPSPGTGESAVRQRVTWEKELAAHFNKFKRYPAERSAKAAEVTVSFSLDSVGHIIASRLVKGSGDAAFDQAALDMLQRADPVPAPPPQVVDRGIELHAAGHFPRQTAEMIGAAWVTPARVTPER